MVRAMRNWRKGGKKERGAPSEVRIFAGWRKGAQMSGVRGSGVEGGLRAVPRGRPAKKKTSFLFNLGEKWKKGRKVPQAVLFVYP